MTGRTTTTVRAAATVMLVRDAPALEVFMLRRSPHSVFVAGAHVFPGGAVEPSDHGAELASRCRGRTDAEASQLLGIDGGGLAFWAAAVRECFEEAGVLLASGAGDGAPLALCDPETERRFAGHRHAVDHGETSLADVLAAEDLVIDAGAIHYFAHWITPLGAPRRYDTRFFVAAAPPHQEPRPDRRETVDGMWVEPAAALDLFHDGEIDLIVPTVASLEALARFERADDLLAAAAVPDTDPELARRLTPDRPGARILLPGDSGYDRLAAAGES